MNIDQIRKDTPACEYVIHFNSAGSSLPPQVVVNSMTEFIQTEAQMGGYEIAEMRHSQIEEFYTETAQLLSCKPKNIAFCFSATHAYIQALSSIPFRKGDTIITTDDDYISNQLSFLSLRNRIGIDVVRTNNLENGDLDLDHLNSLIRKHNPRLVAVTHIPTNSGLVQDVEAVGKLCADAGCLYLVDACQSAGQLPLDVNKIKCDFLTATGRKFLRGPRGTGFLYASDRVLDQKLVPEFADQVGLDWSGPWDYRVKETARRFELWEKPYASMVGLAAAIRYANGIGLQGIEIRNQSLFSSLSKKLSTIPGIRLLDKGTKRSSIVTFQPAVSKERIAQILSNAKINFSFTTNESAVIDFAKKGVEWGVRLSPHYFNTDEEVSQVVDALVG